MSEIDFNFPRAGLRSPSWSTKIGSESGDMGDIHRTDLLSSSLPKVSNDNNTWHQAGSIMLDEMVSQQTNEDKHNDLEGGGLL